jgi:NADH dehydrogenase FAD-containing subunit
MATRNVVVIGGGYAGIRVAKDLDDIARVTLVDRKEVFFHRVASLRAGVDERWTRAPLIPYSRLLEHGRVALGKVTGIQTREREVVLASGERLPYDVVVIATGADYPEPARFVGTTAEEAAKVFRGHQRRIVEARRIMVVGGGPSGVELSAEIRLARPDAEVTLAHSGAALLEGNGAVRAGRRALDWLAAHEVRVLLNTFVSPGSAFGSFRDGAGRRIEADLVFWATGTTPNTVWLRLAGHGDWLNDTGHVRVDGHLRVVGWRDVFAVGDVTDISDAKVAPAAFAQGRAAAHNIRAHLDGSGRHRSQSKPYKAVPLRLLAVPFGPGDGVTMMPRGEREAMLLGRRATVVLKSKSLLVPHQRALLGRPAAD